MSRTFYPKKPPATAIRAAMQLSAQRPEDPLSACNICGCASDDMGAWREHDERDQPIAGDDYVVFIGKDHSGCMKVMKKHPRLYAEEAGRPGHFPALCGPCRFRRDLGCTHPELKANGGPGLLVTIDQGFPKNVIICPPPRIVRHARACKGRTCAS